MMAFTLLLIPPFLWSTMMIVGFMVLGQIPPATLTFWTWLIATLSLLPFTLAQLKYSFPLIRREIIVLFFFALFGISGFQLFLYAGLLHASVINASVLSPTIPIMVACLGWPLLREKMSAIQILGVIISLVGACWIASTGDWSNLKNLQLGTGEILILAGNLSMAIYTVMLRLYPTQLSPLVFMTVIAFIGTLQALPLSILEIGSNAGISQAKELLLPLLYIGIVNYSLAYIFWNIAVKRYGATRTAVFLYFVPVFGVILSMIFLNETPFSYHFIGVFLIFLGLFLSLHFNHQAVAANENGSGKI